MVSIMTNARLHLVVATATATAATTVFASHPPTLGSAGALSLALAAAWFVAVALSAWLALSSGVGLVALVRADRAPSALDRFAPPFVRRLVEVALVGSCIVGSAVPASATSRAKRRDIPVVRAPAAVTTTTTTRPAATTRHTTARHPTPTSTTAVPSPAPTTAPAAPSRPLPPAPLPRKEPSYRDALGSVSIAPTSHRYSVRAGDNLWTIARAALGSRASEADVASYWHALIDANHAHLRSGDPNLIYPGEILGMPDRRASQ
jgi:hypothetical protein